MSDSIEPSNLRTLANPFQFTDQDVRTAVDHNDDVWFCAKDVCEALDIEWSGSATTLKNMPENWFMVLNLKTIKGERESLFINEPGLYFLIFRSQKPKAKEFANWVCSDVLPAIRKQGYFGILPSGNQVQLTNTLLKLLEAVSSQDAFIHQVAVQRLRNICNAFGEPMPSLQLLGKDRSQLDMFKGADK